jgi:tRNA-splicing endonuclease subunit Sen34
MASSATAVVEPFPISKLAHRYLLYDINVVTHVRKEHNIIGVLIGTLPQASQQNVFLGLPLELTPEEARLLVEKGAAYIADDTAEHKRNFLANGLSVEERKAYQAALRKQGQMAAEDAVKRSDDRKQAALQKLGASAPATASSASTENWNDLPDDMYTPGPRQRAGKKAPRQVTVTDGSGLLAVQQSGNGDRSDASGTEADEDDDLLFASPSNSFPTPSVRSPKPSPGGSNKAVATAAETDDRPSNDQHQHEHQHVDNLKLPPPPEPFGVTPTTSNLLTHHLAPNRSSHSDTLPTVSPSSYPLYKHLHSAGYFLAPGLRFGCQYMAYPGDPLRFHSHFLCVGKQWDEEFDLMDLVGGGRLGTGVKKGFLLGGVEDRDGGDKEDGDVRTFCVEWGGM